MAFYRTQWRWHAELTKDDQALWLSWFNRQHSAHAWQHPVAPQLLLPQARHPTRYFSVGDLSRGWLTEHTYPLGIKRWTVRRGPVCALEDLSEVLQVLLRAARDGGVCAVTVSPYFTGAAAEDCATQLQALGGRVSSKQGGHIRSTVVDLSPPEDEILCSFNTNTRRQLKRGADLQVTPCETVDDADAFFALYTRMVQLKGADRLARDYVRRLFTVLRDHPAFGRFLIARTTDQVVAGIVVVRGAETSWYLHGTSDAERRDLPLTFACHWRAMQLLKADGARTYDFGGLGDDPTVAVEGINRFKRGFSKTEVQCTPEFDFVLKPLRHQIYRHGRRLEGWL